MTSDMHVERRRRSSQNVIVDCCDVETAIEQFGHHGSDFGVQQHQIAHHHRFAVHRREPPRVSAGLMVTPSRVTLRSDRGETVAMNLTRNGSRFTERRINFFPIYICCMGETR